MLAPVLESPPTIRPLPTPASADDETDGLALPRRYAAVAAILGAIVLVVLDGAIANVALPSIALQLHATPADAVWIVTAYQLTIVMFLLPAAAVGGRLGYRRVFVGGIALFIAASVACALSPSLPWLVTARCLQGLGSAAVMPLGLALLRYTYPRRLMGQAIAWNALVIAGASAAGPAVGAALLSVASWPWLFAVNLPVGALVDGEQQNWAGGVARDREQLGHEAAVLHHVELEPGRLSGGGNFADRAHAHGGQAERHTRRFRRPRRLGLAAPSVHAGQTDRSQDYRHRQLLAEHHGGELQFRDIAQDALAQGYRFDIRDVRPQGRLGVGAAVDVVEQHARQPSLRRQPVVGDAGRFHAVTVDRRGWGLAGAPWTLGSGPSSAALARVAARGSSSNRAASWSVIAPPSCSTSTMVTARR